MSAPKTCPTSAMPSNRQKVRSAIVRAVREKRHDMRLGLLSAIRGAAPVDTGDLLDSIHAGSGDVLVRIDAEHWLWNELGVPNPGNRANRRWLSNAIRRVARRNGVRNLDLNL